MAVRKLLKKHGIKYSHRVDVLKRQFFTHTNVALVSTYTTLYSVKLLSYTW